MRRLTGFALAAMTAGLLAVTPVAAPSAWAQDNATAPAAEAAAAPDANATAAAPAEAAPAAAAAPAPAAAAAAPTPDKGDTSWMLISTVLVLFMIIPGLALFYGGLVR
jgi:Amt family ammonium transporter